MMRLYFSKNTKLYEQILAFIVASIRPVKFICGRIKLIYKAILVGTVLSLAGISCSDDFLETPPPSPGIEDFFISEAAAYSALTGCYDVLGWEADNPFLWIGDILGHDAYKGGEGAGDQPWMEPLLKFDYDPNIPELRIPYKNNYIGINRCNTVIEYVGTMEAEYISNNTKARIIAEAKFLRGYYYFELVKLFGSVPLVNKLLKPSEQNIPRAPLSALWGQIETDFSDAAKVLPLKSKQAASNRGRATAGAAKAYLCKAYIYQQKWADALKIAQEIKASGEYGLEPNYADNWNLNNENGIESVFEIEYHPTGTGDWGDANEGNVYSIFTRSRNNDEGWGFNCPKKEFVDAFESGDPRRDATIIFHGEVLWPGTPDATVADNSFPSNIDRYHAQKYQLPLSQRAVMSDDPNNWKVIRYAEVLLWAAEAAAHTGGDWKAYIKEVRDRAKLGASPYEAEPLKAIYHERHVELGMEGHRLWDIIRQGRGEEVLGKYGYKEAANRYYPIPQAEIDLSGGVLKN